MLNSIRMRQYDTNAMEECLRLQNSQFILPLIRKQGIWKY